MKKTISFLLLLLMLFILLPAQAITLQTVSTFAGTDAAAQTYVDLLKEWEELTQHVIQDESAVSDEAWKARVITDFAAGNEPDILFYFAKTADSAALLSRVVPISEINAAYPDVHLVESDLIAETDGVIYAIPVRAWWEAMFVNVDLFEKYNLPLPTTAENMLHAIDVFQANGIVPISVSFSDIPHYIVEFAILASGSIEQHSTRPKTMVDVPPSWIDGMQLLHELFKRGAFADNCIVTTETSTSQLFVNKKAAMQLDGSWFANGIPKENWHSTIIMPFPAFSDEADSNVIFGGVTSGFYLTRKAWEDPDKRDAAVDLLAFLSANRQRLGGYGYGGKLGDSIQNVTTNATITSVIQDSMNPSTRSELWFSKISGIVDGSIDPIQMWSTIIEDDPWIE